MFFFLGGVGFGWFRVCDFSLKRCEERRLQLQQQDQVRFWPPLFFWFLPDQIMPRTLLGHIRIGPLIWLLVFDTWDLQHKMRWRCCCFGSTILRYAVFLWQHGVSVLWSLIEHLGCLLDAQLCLLFSSFALDALAGWAAVWETKKFGLCNSGTESPLISFQWWSLLYIQDSSLAKLHTGCLQGL